MATKQFTTGTEVPVGQTVKKYMIGLFVYVTDAYKRIKKSTTLEIVLEPNTEEYDFIADMNPTEILKNYKVSLAQDLTMIKGEEDFEYFWEQLYNLPKVPEVKTKVMIAFMFDGDKSAGYRAWETDAQIMFDNINGVDSKINFTINFGGTIRLGTATMSDGTPTFAPAE